MSDFLPPHHRQPTFPSIPAKPGIVVEAGDFVGAVIGFERTYDGDFLRLEDRYGTSRLFKMRPGAFLYEGKRVTLTRFIPPQEPQRSKSGSRKAAPHRAKTAIPSRIWVEGLHDAAIIEKIWGHDLRAEGVAVEYLEGLDNLPRRLEEFQPAPGRRIGVLADHLVKGSKETRIAEGVGEQVLVTGHPYVDIWAAVKPRCVGIASWPEIPRSEDWKTGVCQRLGWGDRREGWNRVYNAVQSYKDLDSGLIGAVERLVDFVTTPISKWDLV